MGILSLLLNFIGKIIGKVVSDALKTPAKKTTVSTEEGDLPPLPADEYDNLYGLSDSGDKGKQ